MITYIWEFKGIQRVISENPDLNLPPKISLLVNIDGVPLFKSSPNQVWPILGKFGDFSVFIISLWHGKGKPACLDEFLKDFLEEYALLRTSGVRIGDNCLEFDINVFICEAPARQFVKNIKSHNG